MSSAPPELLISPEVSGWLSGVGWQIQNVILPLLMGQVALYGSYTVLVVIAAFALMRRPEKSIRTGFLVSALAVTFVLVTYLWVVELVVLQRHLEVLFVETHNPSMSGRMMGFYRWMDEKPYHLGSFWIIGDADTGLLFLLNDALACWRALAVWGSVRKARLLTSLSYLLVFLVFIFWVSCSARETWIRVNPGVISVPTSISSDPNKILSLTSSSASIASNLLSTSMIGFAAFQHIRNGASRMRGARIMVYLTESGVIYLAIQVIRLSLSLSVNATPPPRDPLSRVYNIFGALTAIITAMYTPALIIILKYGYSMADTLPPSLDSSIISPTSGHAHVHPRRNSSIQFKSNVASSLPGGYCLEESTLERSSSRESSEGRKDNFEMSAYPA